MWLRTLDGDLFNLRFAARIDFNPMSLSLVYDGDEGSPVKYPWVWADENEVVREAALENPVSFEIWCREHIRQRAGVIDLIEYRTLAGNAYAKEQDPAEDQEGESEWMGVLGKRLQSSRERRTGTPQSQGEPWLVTPGHFTLNLNTVTTIYSDENGAVFAASASGSETRLLDAEGEAAGTDEAMAWAGAMLDWITDRLKERTPLVDLDEFTAEIIMEEHAEGDE